MQGVLDYRGQKWKAERCGELTLFLSHAPMRPADVSFIMECSFVPPWLDQEEDYESEHRRLYLDVDGTIPDLKDWRELAGLTLEERDEIAVMGETVQREMSEPEVRLWSHGPGGQRTHAKEGWETRVKFGAWMGEGYTLPLEVESFYPTEKARKAQVDLAVKEFFCEDTPEDWAKAEAAMDGWQFRYTGEVELSKIYCQVPLNTADPVEWARGLARRELKLREFGCAYVNGGDMYNETFKPGDGVCGNNRLVVLTPLTEFWREARAKNPERFRKQPKAKG